MAYEARYVFKPHPGADLDGVIGAIRQGAQLWVKHGAPPPRLWTVTAGELGNYVLVVQVANAAEYARVVDSLSADPAFHRWQADNLRDRAIGWV
ncbi:MAG TPA: hypothetical protein VFX50_19455, partial [Gemmatimonadales bacterium]|nr:hypothetical protein [Gemmatimonadales bacterium]